MKLIFPTLLMPFLLFSVELTAKGVLYTPSIEIIDGKVKIDILSDGYRISGSLEEPFDFKMDRSPGSIISLISTVAAFAPDEIPFLVKSSRHMIGDNFYKTIENYVRAVETEVAIMPSTGSVRNRLGSVAHDTGVPYEIANSVGNQYAADRGQMILSAYTLQQLSVAVDGILNGNDSIYYDSDLYQTMALTTGFSEMSSEIAKFILGEEFVHNYKVSIFILSLCLQDMFMSAVSY